MKVTEVLTFDEYFRDKRFKKRIDNIYHKEEGKWIQEKNDFHNTPELMKRDLSGRNVLISEDFIYLGREGKEIPKELQGIVKKGPNCKIITDEEIIGKFEEWLKKSFKKVGKIGKPFHSSSECDD